MEAHIGLVEMIREYEAKIGRKPKKIVLGRAIHQKLKDEIIAMTGANPDLYVVVSSFDGIQIELDLSENAMRITLLPRQEDILKFPEYIMEDLIYATKDL